MTGIQAADLVGRKVGFEKGATAFAVLDEMRKLDGDLARSKNANVAAARDNFMHAVGGVVVRSGQRRCERIGARRSAVLALESADVLLFLLRLHTPGAALITADRRYYDKARREGQIILLADWSPTA